jgi:meiotic recombination protein SPO11
LFSFKKRIETSQLNSIMDFDLLPDVLNDCSPDIRGNLLQNLPRRPLTPDPGDALDLPASRETLASDVIPGNPNQAGAVISKIEDIFQSIADSILLQKQELVIHLRHRQKPGYQNIVAKNGSAKGLYEVRFPSKSPQEAWKFSEFMTPRL